MASEDVKLEAARAEARSWLEGLTRQCGFTERAFLDTAWEQLSRRLDAVYRAAQPVASAAPADNAELVERLTALIPETQRYEALEHFDTPLTSAVRDAIAALQQESPRAVTPQWTGVRDRNGVDLMLGDRVRYENASPYTKEEYWNSEYEIVWDAPSFSLTHVGGGKPSDNLDFLLKHGGLNGNLVLISRASKHPSKLDALQREGPRAVVERVDPDTFVPVMARARCGDENKTIVGREIAEAVWHALREEGFFVIHSDALAHPLHQPAPDAEPVAWRTIAYDGSWLLCRNRNEALAQRRSDGDPIEPLYAAPAPEPQAPVPGIRVPYPALRICPERDALCPHGGNCSFAIDDYHCNIEASRAALTAANERSR